MIRIFFFKIGTSPRLNFIIACSAWVQRARTLWSRLDGLARTLINFVQIGWLLRSVLTPSFQIYETSHGEIASFPTWLSASSRETWFCEDSHSEIICYMTSDCVGISLVIIVKCIVLRDFVKLLWFIVLSTYLPYLIKEQALTFFA